MHKTKFSEIGLASSKGLFFERPNYTLENRKIAGKVREICQSEKVGTMNKLQLHFSVRHRLSNRSDRTVIFGTEQSFLLFV